MDDYKDAEVHVKTRLSKYKVTDMCTTCGLCLGSCPFDVIQDGKSERGFPKMLIVSDLCKGCRLCIAYCPVGAIVVGAQEELMTADALLC